MFRRMILAGAVVVGSVAMASGVASAQEVDCGPEPSPPCVAPTSEVQVEGNVVLPRTGSDIDGTVLIGAGLTAAGVAFAITARQRRRRIEAPAVSS